MRLMLALGAALAGTAVVLGAFGTHALKGSLSPEALGWWQTAVQYQMWHGLALLALAATGDTRLKPSAMLLGVGAALFSASLYAMALTDSRWLGAVTPLGGLLMIAGWALLLYRSLAKN